MRLRTHPPKAVSPTLLPSEVDHSRHYGELPLGTNRDTNPEAQHIGEEELQPRARSFLLPSQDGESRSRGRVTGDPRRTRRASGNGPDSACDRPRSVERRERRPPGATAYAIPLVARGPQFLQSENPAK